MHSFLLLASLFKRASEPYEFAFAAILFVFHQSQDIVPRSSHSLSWPPFWMNFHHPWTNRSRDFCCVPGRTIRHFENRRGEGPGDWNALRLKWHRPFTKRKSAAGWAALFPDLGKVRVETDNFHRLVATGVNISTWPFHLVRAGGSFL